MKITNQKQPSSFGNITSAVLTLVILLSLCGAAQAATVTWDADTVTAGAQDGSGTWNTVSNNWYDGSANVVWPNTTADIAVIGAGTGAAGQILVPGETTNTLNGITFNAAGSGNYNIATTNAPANSSTKLSFGGINPTITVANNVTATNSVPFDGSANITKSGTGTLILRGSSVVWTGDLVVSNGVVETGVANIRGFGAITAGTGKAIVDGTSNGTNTQLRIKHTNAYGQNATAENYRDLVARNGGVIYSAGGNVNNRIGNLTLQGGTLTVDGTLNTYGSLFFGSVGGVDPVVTVSGSAASTINGAGNLSLAGGFNTVFNVDDVTGDSGADLVVSAKVIKGTSVTGTANLVKNGLGTMVMTAANTYATNETTVNAGKLVASSAQTGAGAVTVAANATLGVTASLTSQWQPATLTLGDPCTLEFNSVQNPNTTNAPLAPAAAVSAANVSVNIGSLTGTITVGDACPLLGNVSATNGFTLVTQPANSTGHLAVSANTLVYVVDTYTAVNTNFVTDVWVGSDATRPTWWDIGASTNWTGKALSNSPAGSYAQNDIAVFDDTAATNLVDIRTAVTPASMLFDNSVKAYTVTNSSGGIGGTNTLTKNGTSTLTLYGNNSYTGGTYVNAGALIVNSDSSLGSASSNTVVASGATLLIQGGITSAEPISLAGNGVSLPGYTEFGALLSTNNNTLTGPLTLTGASGARVCTLGTSTLTISGGITSAAGNLLLGDITITNNPINMGAQQVRFGGDGNIPAVVSGRTIRLNVAGNTWGQAWLFFAGIVKLGVDDALSTGGTVLMGFSGVDNSVSTLDLNGHNQTVAGLSTHASAPPGASISITGGGTLTVNLASVTNTFIGVISDGSTPTSIVKANTGTLNLTGDNTYTGNTTVNGGTLRVANTSGSATGSGAVTINSGGTLDGTGLIDGLVTNNAGGTLSPGTSIGTLTLNGNVVLKAGSTNTFEVDGTTPANDQIVLGAAVTYGGVLKIVPSGSFTVGQTFTLFSGPGATTAGNFSSIEGSAGSGQAFSFTNGVLSVVSAGPSGPATLTNSVSGSTLSLSWPDGQGWRLQQQTNALSQGLGTNWVYVTDSSVSSTNITVDSTKGTVFYRLMYP